MNSPDRILPQSAFNLRRKNGSSGRIRTYDQSVNPDFVGTPPLGYHSISVSVLESGAQTSSS